MNRRLSSTLGFGALALLAATYVAKAYADAKVEMGEIEGATYRIDMPERWNGGLVIMNHGYSIEPRKPQPGPPSARITLFTDEGYAVAQSSYSKGGYALPEALEDNEKLRKHFIKEFGLPKAIYATGGAMGATITMLSIERYPNAYTAGLATCCGTLVPTLQNLQANFEVLTLVEYYFPGLFQAITGPPNGYQYNDAETKRVAAVLAANPEKAEIVRRIARRKMADMAGYLTFETYVVHEIQERAGGNPFDTRTTVFNVDDDLAKVNAGVKRYDADPRARAFLQKVYPSPSGNLKRPLLVMSPVYDPIVPVTSVAPYVQVVHDAGAEKNLAFQFFDHEGHGNVSAEEVKVAFDALQAWVHGGPKPADGAGVTIRSARDH
jgi:pimeloyl-ACP methyl ester carboxylesterase